MTLTLDPRPGFGAGVEGSLLRQHEQPTASPGLSMLETIREYALERLEARGEAARVRRYGTPSTSWRWPRSAGRG